MYSHVFRHLKLKVQKSILQTRSLDHQKQSHIQANLAAAFPPSSIIPK